MDETIDCGRGGHRVFENAFPFRKWQVARQQNAAAFITLRQQGEHDLHLLSTLLHVPHLVDDETVASFLISLPNRRSRFAASRSCTSSGQVAYLIFLPRVAINSCAMAHRRWLFPAPGFPKISRFSLRSRNPPSNNIFICRLTFTGNRLPSKFARDFSSGSPDSLNNFPIRFRRRSSHSRCASSSRYRS